MITPGPAAPFSPASSLEKRELFQARKLIKIRKRAPLALWILAFAALQTALPHPATAAKSGRNSLGPTMAVPSGEDAAYIAFDQGQYLTALKLARAAAKKGDAQAHTLIGRIYAEGRGAPKNETIAAQWYKRAAKLGDIEATFAYGVLLAAGRGVKKDRTAAGVLFEKAALKGHPHAHYNLAQLFLAGQGKPENPRRAALHLEYAARKGIVEAQYDLATLYQKGHGVPANALKAAHWMRQAAARGLPSAQYEYAVMLLRGHGFNADKPKAINYLKNAAKRGLPGAQNRLANVYVQGITVRKSLTEAAMWRLLARQHGIKDAALDKVLAKLSKRDLAQAQRAATALQEGAAIGFSLPTK